MFWLILIIIIILLILSLFNSSYNNNRLLIDNFTVSGTVPENTDINVNKCHRIDDQAISQIQNPSGFIKDGKYRINGYTSPTDKYPNGLINKGTVTWQTTVNYSRYIDSFVKFYDRKTNKLVIDAHIIVNYYLDPYNRLYSIRHSYINEKLVSVKMGVATIIEPGLLIFDMQGSYFRTASHFENIKVQVEGSKSGYIYTAFLNDDSLFEINTVTFISGSNVEEEIMEEEY